MKLKQTFIHSIQDRYTNFVYFNYFLWSENLFLMEKINFLEFILRKFLFEQVPLTLLVLCCNNPISEVLIPTYPNTCVVDVLIRLKLMLLISEIIKSIT